MQDSPEIRKKFFNHYKHYIESVEGHDLDYSFNDWLSIYERDYQIYNPEAYSYAMSKLKEGVDICK